MNQDEVANNFSRSKTVLDESAELSKSRSSRLDQVIDSKDTALGKQELQKVQRLEKSLLKMLNSLEDQEVQDDETKKNQKVLRDLIATIKRLVQSGKSMLSVLQEDRQAFKLIEETSEYESRRLDQSEQGMTYTMIFWEVIGRFLNLNKITAETPMLSRPNVYEHDSYHLKAIYNIFNRNHTNKSTRTHLCLGCWTFMDVNKLANRKGVTNTFKSSGYPLFVRFSYLVDTVHNKLPRPRMLCIQDLIFFLYCTNHEFISHQAKLIWELEDNAQQPEFVPFPLFKRDLQVESRANKGRHI